MALTHIGSQLATKKRIDLKIVLGFRYLLHRIFYL
jgi:hypothetical protein